MLIDVYKFHNYIIDYLKLYIYGHYNILCINKKVDKEP